MNTHFRSTLLAKKKSNHIYVSFRISFFMCIFISKYIYQKLILVYYIYLLSRNILVTNRKTVRSL